ncbi:hypothetical protein D3C83_07130 [compost metagenome]
MIRPSVERRERDLDVQAAQSARMRAQRAGMSLHDRPRDRQTEAGAAAVAAARAFHAE